MSTDLRDRLHQAASAPSTPLNVEQVYRRGRRIRAVRLLSGAAAATAVVVVGAVIVAPRPTPPAPVIGSVQQVEEVFADGRVSWREYRVAVAATADCLEAASVDRSHRFDHDSGTFEFMAESTAPFEQCRDRHLADAEDAWRLAITTDTGGVTWTELRTAHEGLAECLQEAGLSAGDEFNLAQGYWSMGYSIRADAPDDQADAAEQSFQDCQRAHDIPALQQAWEKLTGPSAAEQHQPYAFAAQCMRDLGHHVPDAQPDTLSAAIAQWPDDYDRCLEQGRAAAQPYLDNAIGAGLFKRLAGAEERWSNNGVDSYSYVFDDAARGNGPVTVRVSNGQRTSGDAGFTIDELFRHLHDSLNRAEGIEIAFHPELGYPTRVKVTPDEAAEPIADITISELRPATADHAS